MLKEVGSRRQNAAALPSLQRIASRTAILKREIGYVKRKTNNRDARCLYVQKQNVRPRRCTFTMYVQRHAKMYWLDDVRSDIHSSHSAVISFVRRAASRTYHTVSPSKKINDVQKKKMSPAKRCTGDVAKDEQKHKKIKRTRTSCTKDEDLKNNTPHRSYYFHTAKEKRSNRLTISGRACNTRRIFLTPAVVRGSALHA